MERFRDAKDQDGAQLWWLTGLNGYPIRGPKPPLLTRAELSNLPLVGKFRRRTFRLWDPEEAKAYEAVQDRCINGIFHRLERDKVWSETNNDYQIYLEWVELAYEVPANHKFSSATYEGQVIEPTQNSVAPYDRLAGVARGW
jgi:hypothetical protein